MRGSILVLVAVVLIPSAAWTQEPKPKVESRDPQLLDYARSNPNCTGFTDQCQTCIRAPDQSIQCSMPGIACVQQPWTCNQQKPRKP